MDYSEEQDRIDRQKQYEQLFGSDYDGFQNNNVEEKANVINNQINNDAILYNYTQNNIYESSYVQEKHEDDEHEHNEKSAEDSALLFIKKLGQILEEKKKKILFVIDRFEGDIAVCENRETEEIININKNELPDGINEGDVLSFDGEKYEVDEEAKKEIEERIKNKIRNIFEEN